MGPVRRARLRARSAEVVSARCRPILDSSSHSCFLLHRSRHSRRPLRRTRPSPARSRPSPRPPASRASFRPGSPTCPPRPRCPRPAPSWGASRARRASSPTPPQAHGYCRALAAASPRVRVFTIGRSEEGREILLLAIADEAGIRDLDRLKARHRRPRRPAPHRSRRSGAAHRARAADLLLQRRAARRRDGQRRDVLELAYRLAVSEQPMIRRIRENLVVLINPVSNPDGRDKMADWFYRYLKGKTDYAALPRQSPPYWSRYAFVDINRDAHQLVHEATRAVHRMFHEWHPDGRARPARGHRAAHDLERHRPLQPEHRPHHAQRVPGAELARGADADRARHAGRVDLELRRGLRPPLPGLGGHEPQRHRPRLRDLRQRAPRRRCGGRSTPVGRHRASGTGPAPPPRRVHAGRCATTSTTTQTAALAALDTRGAQREGAAAQLLPQGLELLAQGRGGAAVRVRDPRRTRATAARGAAGEPPARPAHRGGARSNAAFAVDEGAFRAGSYVVRLDQPYRNYAVDLLAPQDFPKNGGEPYDDVSWALPAHYRLEARRHRRSRDQHVGALRR